jgi:predicted nucleotide-binding protein with TIR-like domain
MLCLDDCYSTTIMPQLTEITQFIFGQPLRADKGEMMKARDNCVFEAGLFMSAIGRKRCFLVNSVSQNDLPTDLAGIISIPFKEPDPPSLLQDRQACGEAMHRVVPLLKNRMQEQGPSAFHGRLPVLTIEELLRREAPVSEKGDLTEDRVLVMDDQPSLDINHADRILRNLDDGSSYHYLFTCSEPTIKKTMEFLQIIVCGTALDAAKALDPNARSVTIAKDKDKVLSGLKELSNSGRLRFTLLPNPPTVAYRVHNASDSKKARRYAKRFVKDMFGTSESVQFVLWDEGQNAALLWSLFPQYIEVDNDDRLFLWLNYPKFDDEYKIRIKTWLNRALKNSFPGIEREVEYLCFGDTLHPDKEKLPC